MKTELNIRRQSVHGWLTPLLVLAMTFWIGSMASGQAAPSRSADDVRQETGEMDRAGDHDVTRGELSTMDRFLDSHPEIAEQLRKDPSLIKNEEFVDKHPALQEFLQAHPGVREEFTEHPNAFMREEGRFDHREELASLDRFLDGHPEIAEQLRKTPSLIRDKKFVADHPGLQEYLQTHPDVREEFRENPDAFMRQEEWFEHREDRDRMTSFRDADHDGDRTSFHDADRDRDRTSFHDADRDRDRTSFHDADRRDRDNVSFGEFLGGHSSLAQQLSRDPSLANNKEFLASHAELQQYLQTHPDLSQQLAKDPQGVISMAVQPNNSTPANPKVPTKPKQ